MNKGSVNFMKKFFFIFGLLFFYGFSFAGLSVDPAIVDVVADASSSYEGKYVLKNTYDIPITVILKVEDWNTYSGNTNTDVNRWLKFDKDKYYIPSGELIEVPYKISLPEDMKGSVSGRVYFSVEQQQGQMVTIAISVPIYVVVKGTEKIDFKIDSFDLQNSKKGISYKFVIKNDGNIHFRPSGVIEIYDKKKKKLIRTVFISETVPVYAEKNREFSGVMTGNDIKKDGLKKGKYTAVLKIKALGRDVSKEIKFKVSKLGEVVTS
ncbi:MAG: hypothetical protein AB7E39_07855 [Endomicrobiaceae bacterium]